jgi:small-conductance mechanosensitive channel
MSAIARVWHYLNQYYEIGSVRVSVTSVLEGLLVLAATVFLSRVLTRLLQRRIAKRAYLDPGLQYTLGRLTQYLIFILGVLLAI